MHYRIQRQISIPLENHPGRLAAISGAIASLGIEIEALTVLDSLEQAMVRLVTSDPDRCKQLLGKQGLCLIESEVLRIELTDSPGQLALLSQAMADAQINIDYAYGSAWLVGEKAVLIMKVSNAAQACQVLDALVKG